MRDGRQTAELRTKEASADQIIAAMGGSIGADPPTAQPATEPARHADEGLDGQSQAPILSRTAGGGTGEELSFTVLPGEIVGLAGLEGQGQTELLAEIWRMSRRSGWLWRGQRRWTMTRRFSAAYVSGDRQQFGLLPLWEVRRNISVASLSSLRSFGLLLAGRERSLTDRLGKAGADPRGRRAIGARAQRRNAAKGAARPRDGGQIRCPAARRPIPRCRRHHQGSRLPVDQGRGRQRQGRCLVQQRDGGVPQVRPGLRHAGRHGAGRAVRPRNLR